MTFNSVLGSLQVARKRLQSEKFISQEHGGVFKALHLLFECTNYFDLQTYFIVSFSRTISDKDYREKKCAQGG